MSVFLRPSLIDHHRGNERTIESNWGGQDIATVRTSVCQRMVNQFDKS